MTEFASLRDALDALRSDLDSYHDSVNRFVLRTCEMIAAQERTDSELRDDLCAVANRVETLVRAVMADPSDVASSVIRLHGGDAA